MPRTALYFDDDAFFGASVKTHTQPELSSAELISELRLVRILGRGSFGTACLCRFRGGEWVVKLPRSHTLDHFLEESTLPDVMTDFGSAANRERVLRQFARECRNAEAVLDAPEVRRMRAKGTGRRLECLTDTEYDQVCEARRVWCAKPGYAHMHPVVHYDPEIPLLMSLPAEGTLCEMRIPVSGHEASIPFDWVTMAWQLSEAVEFLRAEPKLAHVDIKPDNVLFVYKDSGVHCWLSDYGDLYPKDDWLRSIEVGTPGYVPEYHELLHLQCAADATYEALSLFEYYATVLDLFKVHAQLEDGTPADVYLSAYDRSVGTTVRKILSPEGWGKPLAPLAAFFQRQPALLEHVVAGLELGNFDTLSERFAKTRRWLRERMPIARPFSRMTLL